MFYDYVMFFNENDILDIRLHTHDPVVDKFIIVEAGQTHMGDPKPFFFDKERFKKFKDKIIYVQIPSLDEAMAEHPEITQKSAAGGNARVHHGWAREEFQINYFYKVAEDIGIKDDDIVSWGGLDEIISQEGFKQGLEIIEQNPPSETHHQLATPIVTYEWDLRCYKLNLKAGWGGHGSSTMKYAEAKYIPFARARALSIFSHTVKGPVAWHLSFMSKEAENLAYKYRSFAHGPECADGHKAEDAETKVFNNFNLSEAEIETLPQYIQDNPDLFEGYWWKNEN